MHLRPVLSIRHTADDVAISDFSLDSPHSAHSSHSFNLATVDARISIVVQFRALHAHQVPAGHIPRAQPLGLGPGAGMGPEAAVVQLVDVPEPADEKRLDRERRDESAGVAVGSVDEEPDGVGRGGCCFR